MNYSRRKRFYKNESLRPDDVDNEVQMLADNHNDHDAGRKGWTRARLTSGTVQSTPVAGTLEYDGTKLSFVDQDDRRAVALCGNTITSTTTVSNTAVETTVYTAAISADELHQGMVVTVRILGFYSTANASDTFTLRCKLGSTTVTSITSTAANVTNTPLDAEFVFTVRSTGASGTVFAYTRFEANAANRSTANTSATTIDTTIAENFTFTVQWSNALSGNTISIAQGFALFIN